MKKIFLAIFMVLLIMSCEKKPLPVPTYNDVKLEVTVGDITKTSAKASVKVEAGSHKIISSGVCYNTTGSPTIEDQKILGSGTIKLVNLEIGTKYYVRAYAAVDNKNLYSSQQEFITEDLIVSLIISDVTKRGATISFQTDASLPGIVESGVYYSKANDYPTEADKKMLGSNSLKLDLLSYETKYFVRAYIKTASRTYYSKVQNFTTIKLPTVKDYDGNVYRIIEMPSTAGLTYWLLDNFKGTHFANGDPIPNITDNTEWTQQTGPAYCHYNNDPKNTETYGALYNWYVASDPRGLITGWQAPTDKQWLEMSDYWGTVVGPGGKFKEEGFVHWKSPNTEANNESGFTALPGGIRSAYEGNFVIKNELAIFVTYDSYGSGYWSRRLEHDTNHFSETGVNLLTGASIRLRKK